MKSMKSMKNSLVVVLIFFSAIVLVKFNYRDTSESRGFDFSMPLQFEKNYLLLRFLCRPRHRVFTIRSGKKGRYF